MHIQPEELKRPMKDRTSVEKAFKWINKIITAIQLGCLLLAIANVTISTGKTIDSDMWGINQGISIKGTITNKLVNCTLSRSSTIGASTGVSFVMSTANVYIYLAQLMYDLKAMISVTALCIFLGAINKLLFDLNTFKFTYGEITFRKDLISTVDVLSHILGIVLVAGVANSASDLKAYFEACGVVGQNSLPYTPPFPEIYVALSFGLAGHLVCGLAHLVIAMRKLEENEKSADIEFDNVVAARQPQAAPTNTRFYQPANSPTGDDLRTAGAAATYSSTNVSPRQNLRAPTSGGSNRGRDT